MDGAPVAPGRDCFPPCIARVRADCQRPVTGSCTKEVVAGANQYCYSNGVKEVRAGPPQLRTFVNRFFKPGGELCYTEETVSPPASAIVEVVFTDASGREVARGTHGVVDFDWTITCEGMTYRVDDGVGACKTVAPGDCRPGTCR